MQLDGRVTTLEDGKREALRLLSAEAPAGTKPPDPARN
jgi:hypothetical protein